MTTNQWSIGVNLCRCFFWDFLKTSNVGKFKETHKWEITVELPDEFDSIEQLETIIDAEGQKIKQRLFEKELQARIDEPKRAIDEPSACPHCQKKTPSTEEVSDDNWKPSSVTFSFLFPVFSARRVANTLSCRPYMKAWMTLRNSLLVTSQQDYEESRFFVGHHSLTNKLPMLSKS